MATPPAADLDALNAYAKRLFATLDGAVTATMVHLGDQLGLYRALAGADGPMSSGELADSTGLDERWVREWLHNQAAADLVSWEPGATPDGARYWLAPEAVAVTAQETHPAFGMGWFHRLPHTLGSVERLPESFRSGIGFDYDVAGPDGAVGMERAFEPWFGTFLVPVVLPLLEGVEERLRAGGTVADIGCGTGSSSLLLARAFPEATVVGYEISSHALDRARRRAADEGIGNVSFVDPRQSPLPDDGSVDLVLTIDCLHDMAHPAEMAAAIAAALAPGGSWLLVDIKARESFAENVAGNPMASMMYGISVLSCLASATSEPDGAGLGTLGLPEAVARRIAADVGLTGFRRLAVDHPVNAFYEVRHER